MDTSEMVPMLVSTPSPIEGESLLGYLLRVSEVNGYKSPTWITNLCGIPYSQFYRKKQNLNKLSVILGQPVEKLESLAWRYFPNEVSTDGKPIKVPSAYKPLLLDKPKICSDCIEENGITNPAWDLAWFHVCPTHKTFLSTHCSACGEGISWCRTGLNMCPCGAVFPPAAKRCADDSTIQLLRHIDDLIHGRPIGKSQEQGSQIGALASFKLTELMTFLDRISKVIEETNSGRVVRRIDRSPEMLAKLAKFFSNWPAHFHGLLKQMHDKAHQQPKSISISLSVVFKKLLGNSHGSGVLINGKTFTEQIGYLEGAYFFSPPEGCAHKNSVLKTERDADGAEYATISNLAAHLGVHKATVKNWAKAGAHGLSLAQEGRVKNRRRVKLNPDFPKKTSARCLTPRLASKHIGIPESVLIRLRQDGYYKPKYFSRFPGDFQAEDLALLESRFVRKAPDVLPVLPEGGITFDQIRLMSFGGPEVKYSIYRAILDGGLKPKGRISGTVRGIVVDFNELTRFTEMQSIRVLESLPAYKAAKVLCCSLEVISGLHDAGYLQGYKRQKTLQISSKSLEKFQGSYVSCAAWANQLKTSARALVSRYEYKLPMVRIEDQRRGVVSHFCLKSAIKSRLKGHKFCAAEGQASFSFPEDLPFVLSKGS